MTSQKSTDLLTPEQVSNLLHVEEHTLAVWRSEGRYNLPYIKIGRKVLYKLSDVESFIESRTRGRCEA